MAEMKILHSLEDARALGLPTVVAAGNFDGVHRGHQAILSAVATEARRRGALGCVLTFEPHPHRILRPQNAVPLITPLPEKLRRLGECGLDAAVVLPFTRDLSLLSPLEFVERVLVRGLQVVSLHEGANFRFGHRQAGDVGELDVLSREFAFALHVHAPVLVGGLPVSSSRVRAALAGGDVVLARHLLGRAFGVSGAVVAGHGRGRRETVPTFNLQPYDELLPQAGVYVTRTRLDGGDWCDSVTNVGIRPTVSSSGVVVVETHLLGGAPPVAEALELAFLHRLREERRFASTAALAAQIGRDTAQARRFFERLRHGSSRGFVAAPSPGVR